MGMSTRRTPLAKNKNIDLTPEEIAYYQGNWVAFIEDQILCLTPEQVYENKRGARVEPEQKEIVTAVQNNMRVSARSGHGIGKTAADGFIVITFISLYENARIIITGSKYDQLKMTTWAEIGKFYMRSRVRDLLEYTAEKLVFKASPQTWFASIVTARDQESITGLHEDHVLVVVDEASGEAIDKMRDALMGCLTGPNNHILLCGNPTRTQGWFFDTFHTDAALWKHLHYNAENSSLVSPESIEYWRKKYDVNSPQYMVRVLGEFPPGNPRAIIPWDKVNAAMDRHENGEWKAAGPLEIGVDPAFEGDDLATIAIRQGNVLHRIVTHPKATPIELNRFVVQDIRDARRDFNCPSDRIKVKVDAHGGYAASLIEALTLNENDNVDVVPIYSNASATDAEYKGYGTQMWFDVGADIDELVLCRDEFLLDELAGREWRPAEGVMVIRMESKIDFKSRLGRSPDRADACVLAFAGGPKKIFTQGTSNVMSTNFTVDWEIRHAFDSTWNGPVACEIMHYVGLVMGKDLTLGGIGAMYEYFRNKLWIYTEYWQDTPLVTELGASLREKSRMGMYNADYREPNIVGNALMFKETGGRRPLADVFREQARVVVREPVRYDEFGAIALGVEMFNAEKVTVHVSCPIARKQLSLWSVRDKKVQEDEALMCKALLLILSEVRRRKRPEPQGAHRQDYQRVAGPQADTSKRPERWMAR